MRDNFDLDWRFFRGDAQGAQEPAFEDTGWQLVDLPHDFSIDQPIEENNPGGRSMGFYPGGLGWYRKTFTLPSKSSGKQVFIDFDGVYWKSDVWINGTHLGFRPYGYAGFRYDLTPFLDFNGTNVLAVRVDNSEQPNSRWYTGSGIYRHCWLNILDPFHVAHWGVSVATPDVSEKRAFVVVNLTIENKDKVDRHANAVIRIRDGLDCFVAEADSAFDVPAGEEKVVFVEFEIDSPHLWSPQTPYLYGVDVSLEENGRVVDSPERQPLGIRTVRFDPQHGFFLNGQNMKLKGVNIHQNAGGVGAAVPDRMIERRLRLLKEMGCNAIRTSHYAHSPVLLDLCDRMGFLVMDEIFDEWYEGKRDFSYFRFFHEWWQRDLTAHIQRDRNHPCVFIWSIGNENKERKTPEGAAMAREMVEFVHRLEPTRLVTAGVNHVHWANESGFAQALDVVGYNDGGGSCFHYAEDKQNYPDRLILGLETPHTFSTRGVYRTLTRHRGESGKMQPWVENYQETPHLTEEEVFPFFHSSYQSSYDNANSIINVRDSWLRTASTDFVAGEFRWTGIDYLGESHEWPARSSNSGLIDLAGFPKDQYFLYQRFWSDKAMLHILPHWTWPQIAEGTVIPVWAYSNCESVELFLNNESLGEQVVNGQPNLSWNVPYRPGVLKAVARNSGEVILVKEQRTASAAARLDLAVDRTILAADGRDIAHVTVRALDEAGTFMPLAHQRVTFSVLGAGRLIGLENGDPIDHDNCKADSRRLFHGLCLAIIQAGRVPGSILVRAEAPGLAPAQIEFLGAILK